MSSNQDYTCDLGEPRSRVCYDLSAWDYVVFGLLFAVSASIGLYFACQARRRQANSDDYLLGGREMSAVPVALSLTASFVSAITVLGTPAEFYIYGTMFFWFALTYTITTFVVSEIYLPLFYRLNITSTYEYLEMRFSRSVRLLATTVYIIYTIMYVGIVIYAPALALNEVTGLGIWWSVALTAAICIFYTTLGGLKAVIWTDVFQCLVMCIGFVAILIKGSSVMGGFSNVWRIASEGGRIQFNHFEVDPRIRHTFWSILCGGSFLWVGLYGTTQTMIQRYISCKSENQAKLALFINLIGLYVVLVLPALSGLVMYAYYAGCDPYSKGWVGASDQLMPYFVLELLHDYPGLPGVFVCSVFSGALSTISSGINGMATVTVEDYIKPVKTLTPRSSVIISKVLVVVFGLVCTAMAVLASQLGAILEASLSIAGIINGPMVGLFTLAMLLPWSNSYGALAGLCAGLASTVWIYIGSTIYPPSAELRAVLPLCTNSCNDTSSCGVTETDTSTNSSTVGTTDPPDPPIADFYAMSYLYYSAFGCIVTIVVGLATSFATGYQRPSELKPELTWPIFDHFLFRWIPKKIRHKLHCGVNYDVESEEKSEISSKEDFGWSEFGDQYRSTLENGNEKGEINYGFVTEDNLIEDITISTSL